jgi:sugar lactone lactonase YvrE
MTMAKRKTEVKKGRPGRVALGKGAKAFLFLLGASFLAILGYLGYDRLSQALQQAKQLEVLVDLEISGPGREGFQEPWGVAMAPSGDFLVSDFSGHRILRFDQDGKFLGSFGKRGKEAGEFEQPSGLYVDPSGSIFVCDTFNHRLQKLDPEGKVRKIISRSFFGPRSVAGDGRSRVYVADTGNHKIQAFDLNGGFQREWGGRGREPGRFDEPVGLAVGPDGSVFVADSDNTRIQRFDRDGKLLGVIKVALWNGKNRETPYLAFSQGSLFATNASFEGNKGAVLKFSEKGSLEAVLRRKEGFPGAAGLAVDLQGRLLVVEKGIGKVARFSVPLPR